MQAVKTNIAECVEENSKLWNAAERDAAEGKRVSRRELEASLQETSEDHLGVALIQPGDSVIIINEVFP